VEQVGPMLKWAQPILAEVKKSKPLASKAIQAMKTDLKEPAELKVLEMAPDNLTTRREGEEWLKEEFQSAELTGGKLTKALEFYDGHFDNATRIQLKELGASFDEVKSSLDQTGLQIIPKPIPSFSEYCKGLHLLGVIMTWLFLSLGAPFWFNALSQLANLRPILAGKIQKQASEEQKPTSTT
jgi:hypothetical protein